VPVGITAMLGAASLAWNSSPLSDIQLGHTAARSSLISAAATGRGRRIFEKLDAVGVAPQVRQLFFGIFPHQRRR